jgi:hypothetical protein
MMIHDPFEGNVPVLYADNLSKHNIYDESQNSCHNFFYFHDRTVIEELSTHLAI